MIPQYRIEQYLGAINAAYLGDSPLPEYPSEPVWRIEVFLAAILSAARGDSPVMACPDPVWRIEEFARAIYDALVGASPAWPCPTATNNIEAILLAIYNVVADGTETDGIMTSWDIEKWLMDSYDAAKEGGGIEKTVSGTMVHITDALAKAALSVLVSIEPIQDLHGYSSPWPAGGGKNAMPSGEAGTKKSNGITVTSDGHGHYTVSGTSSSAAEILFDLETEFTIPTSDTHSLFFMNDIGVSGVTFYFRNGSTNVDSFGLSTANKVSASYVTIGGKVCNRVRFYISPNTAITGTMHLSPMIVTKDVTGNSFIPYSNICPITGRTGVSVYRTGINIWDEEWERGTIGMTTGAKVDDNTKIRSKNYVPISPNTAYYYKFPGNWRMVYLDADKNVVERGNTYSPNIILTSPATAHYLLFALDATTEYDNNIAINYPATDHDYHAYNGNTYAVDWTSEAGTVYGGTLDVVSGELTVDMVNIPSYNGETINEPWLSSMDEYAPGATPTTGAQVVYKLATPLTYQLTAQEVQMLLGENNIWASSGDTVSVTYYAEGNANPLQSLNILLGGNYSNPKTADDVSDKEALEIILGGNK